MKSPSSLDAFRLLLATVALGACGGSTVADDRSTSSGGTVTGGPDASPPVTTTPVGIATTGFEPICSGRYDALAGVTPGTPVDYFELRSEVAGNDAQLPQVSSRSGTACATATNTTKCLSDLASFRSLVWIDLFSPGAPRARTYLVTTFGDDVKALATKEAIRDFVAPVESPEDAAFLVSLDGRHRITCDKPAVKRTASGWEVLATTGTACGRNEGLDEVRFAVSSAGVTTLLETVRIKEGDPTCAIGRIPEGLVPIVSSAGTLGEHFAEIARLEAASVVAFERIGGELARFGAPAGLVALARASAVDEQRHTELTSQLARRFGAEPLRPVIADARERTLFDLALENATEGCVRETFGAVVATHQAAMAEDEEIRAIMHTIAEDETKHAWFSWELHRWATGVLGPDDAARLASARTEAVSVLTAVIDAAVHPAAVLEVAGHPSPTRARAMLEGLTSALS